VLGWASLSRWSEREGYARTAENSVYVHADAQGKGVGRALMLELLRSGEAQGVRLVIARINNGNEASVRFHESLGFQTIGVMARCGQKFGRVIDVRIMGWQSTLE
jgi:phosphinothricin acetyltransferase